MPIDFHHISNTNTYASRRVDDSWLVQMTALLAGSHPGRVADIGCGGGIYSRGWKILGARSVIGIDFSGQMIEDARSATNDDSIQFALANAYDTRLNAGTVDIVFSRAVIHHLSDYVAAMAEAFRIVRPGGAVIVQDRTIEDVLQPASPNHFRAHFFSKYPRLLDEERRRRPATDAFMNVLDEAGFVDVECEPFWETRKTHADAESVRNDLLSRTGRSILHDLSDAELTRLTDAIVVASEDHFPVREKDRWTMWVACKPND